ncbi:MAG: hypothetical protein EXX96DRAFT_613371 [Benjaminiella poitrasii]|nr:MAG: hypothetical protein EXX96DRAFT_613371 [Benjaminiella poitrasii]
MHRKDIPTSLDSSQQLYTSVAITFADPIQDLSISDYMSDFDENTGRYVNGISVKTESHKLNTMIDDLLSTLYELSISTFIEKNVEEELLLLQAEEPTEQSDHRDVLSFNPCDNIKALEVNCYVETLLRVIRSNDLCILSTEEISQFVQYLHPILHFAISLPVRNTDDLIKQFIICKKALVDLSLHVVGNKNSSTGRYDFELAENADTDDLRHSSRSFNSLKIRSQFNNNARQMSRLYNTEQFLLRITSESSYFGGPPESTRKQVDARKIRELESDSTARQQEIRRASTKPKTLPSLPTIQDLCIKLDIPTEKRFCYCSSPDLKLTRCIMEYFTTSVIYKPETKLYLKI